jgi:hypothetical protein
MPFDGFGFKYVICKLSVFYHVIAGNSDAGDILATLFVFKSRDEAVFAYG